ncbi:MAG: deoxycytidine triphosphate deaminase [Desulforhopalus sp.]|jgi:deoxycytidine triphosphate deaminase
MNAELKTLEENFDQIRSLLSSYIPSGENDTDRLANKTGLLSDVDVLENIENQEIVITPFENTRLSPVGYNLSFTRFLYSVNNNLLLKIEKDDITKENYCYVPPNDTVLVLTNEAVWVSENIAGTFHSKVGIVSKGFGHIGTTLDPNWEGPLLISINNPTKKKIKLVVSSEVRGLQKYKSFATLIFYRMVSPSKGVHDNLPSRIDILKDKKASLAKKRRYKDLIDIIDKILNFESLHVGIGNFRREERPLKIKEFKQKYSYFAPSLNENIIDGQKVSGKIKFWNKIYYGLIFIVIGGCLSWDLWYAINANLDKKYEIVSLMGIVTAVLVGVAIQVEGYAREKLLT